MLVLEKRTYNGLPDFMTKVAQEELGKLDASISECNILYLPQVSFHFLTCVLGMKSIGKLVKYDNIMNRDHYWWSGHW